MSHENQPGDKVLPSINMPVNKNELMLLNMALREYGLQVANRSDLPEAAKTTLQLEIAKLKAKLESNEISCDSLG